MRFRIVFVRRPSSSCGLSYIPTKANNAEKGTSRAHMWAHMGPFQGLWEVGPRPYAGRIRPPFRLQSCLYWPGDGRGLARPSQKRNSKKNAKLPKWQLIPPSCHNGNFAHIPTPPAKRFTHEYWCHDPQDWLCAVHPWHPQPDVPQALVRELLAELGSTPLGVLRPRPATAVRTPSSTSAGTKERRVDAPRRHHLR
jgi:hypothetical protein